MNTTLIIGGLRYETLTDFVQSTPCDAGPLEVSNAECVSEALESMLADEDEPDPEFVHLNDYCFRDAVNTKTREELETWISSQKSYTRYCPDDLKVFLRDEPPTVVVCESTQNVYVLEDSENEMQDLLSAYASYPLLDESLWSEKEQEMTEEAWNDWGRDDIIAEIYGLQEALDSLPHGPQLFDIWYFRECSEQSKYYEWSGPDVSFPVVGESNPWGSALDAEDELWEYIDTHIWACFEGKTPERENALTLLCLSTGNTPRDVLLYILDDERYRSSVSDAAPYPALYHNARCRLEGTRT